LHAQCAVHRPSGNQPEGQVGRQCRSDNQHWHLVAAAVAVRPRAHPARQQQLAAVGQRGVQVLAGECCGGVWVAPSTYQLLHAAGSRAAASLAPSRPLAAALHLSCLQARACSRAASILTVGALAAGFRGLGIGSTAAMPPSSSQSAASQSSWGDVSAAQSIRVGAASQVLAALASGPAASSAGGGEGLRLSIDQLNGALPDSRMVTMIAQAAALPSRTGALEERDPERARQSALKLVGRYRQERHAAVASVLAAAAASPPAAATAVAAGAASVTSSPRPPAAAGGYGYGGGGGFAAHSHPMAGYSSGGGAAAMGSAGGAGAPLPTATTADILRAVVRQDEARHREIGCETVRHAAYTDAASGGGSHRVEALPGTRWSLERLQAYVTHVKVSSMRFWQWCCVCNRRFRSPVSLLRSPAASPHVRIILVCAHAPHCVASAGNTSSCAIGGRLTGGRPLLCATAPARRAPSCSHHHAPARIAHPVDASACSVDVSEGCTHPRRHFRCLARREQHAELVQLRRARWQPERGGGGVWYINGDLRRAL